MRDELEIGGKVYLVYPVIEQSEQLPQLRAASEGLESISYRFHDYSCGLLHGKMKSDEKEEALRRFRNGDTQILLATQVIEIGVDVPDASMMVVMNAERFGIAQLHQLRGRVGRGTKKSRCLLVASTASALSRLKVLENSSDGFRLAEFDLLLRGPGDLLGKKQSGHLPEFPVARLEIDGNILEQAHLAALVSTVSFISFHFSWHDCSALGSTSFLAWNNIRSYILISNYAYLVRVVQNFLIGPKVLNGLCLFSPYTSKDF